MTGRTRVLLSLLPLTLALGAAAYVAVPLAIGGTSDPCVAAANAFVNHDLDLDGRGLAGPERAMARAIAVPMIAESVRSRGLYACWSLMLNAREAAEGQRAENEREARR